MRVDGPSAAERSLVRSLSLSVFIQWAGASSILPLLPVYLRHRGASDTMVGVVIAAFFIAGVLSQYPAGRAADRFGRRKLVVAGLLLYALATLAFLAPVGPSTDVLLRALQGVGSGAVTVSALAMVGDAVPIERRGRAFGTVYGALVAGLAVGPLIGSVVGGRSMAYVFLGAALASIASCVVVVRLTAVGHGGVGHGGVGDGGVGDGGAGESTKSALGFGRRSVPEGRRGIVDRSVLGALLAAAAVGSLTGVYETCWTLLLRSNGASAWQVGLSWTLFAVPFVAMARPSGWLADHLDRPKLVIWTLLASAGFCVTYPFLHVVGVMLWLGCLEAVAAAASFPAAQSLLTQTVPEREQGRVQGLSATSQTAATALAACVGGYLFGRAAWMPFVFGAAVAIVLVVVMAVVWSPVDGRVRSVEADEAEPAGPEPVAVVLSPEP